jgi:transcriptional regulator with XRE-family HTH domain
MKPPLTPEACRAARAILQWSMRDLAERSGVKHTTIHAIENGSKPRAATEAKLVAAFEAAGVEITNGTGTGARLRLDQPATDA